MIATVSKLQHHLCVGIALGLLVLMGFKAVVPVILMAKAAFKEISANTESDENKTEKKSENDPSSERNKEYASIYSKVTCGVRSFVQIVHVTGYRINYQSQHYFEICTPPPDYIYHIA